MKGIEKRMWPREWFSANGAPVLLSIALLAVLSGCDPVSLTLFGVGSAAGVDYTMNGIAYRTFTAPLPSVRAAALAALGKMGFKSSSREKTKGGELVKANAAEREIEVELEAISANTTRMRCTVRNGALMDRATATEIIIQTEKGLNGA